MSGNRHPKNMEGVLRLAVEAQQQDSENQTHQATMSPERRQFLEGALASLSTEIVTVMQANLKTLMEGIEKRRNDVEEGNEEINNQEQALENVLEVVDNLDNANDFQKIGGFSVILPLLKTVDKSLVRIRWMAAELLGTLVQNNPFCQNAALMEDNGSIVGVLLSLMDSNDEEVVKVKAVFALSCLTRGNPDAQKIFQEKDGFSYLLKAIQSNVEKLRIKSCFLLTSFCGEVPSSRDVLFNMGYVELFASLLHREHSNSDEHLLSALLSLITEHKKSLNECLRPELELKITLTERIAHLRNQEQYMEEVDYCQRLLDKCFPARDNDVTER